MKRPASKVSTLSMRFQLQNRAFSEVWSSCALTNVRRIRLAALIAIPLELSLVLQLLIPLAQGQVYEAWKMTVLYFHVCFTVVMGLTALAAHLLRNHKTCGKRIKALTILFAASIQGTGILVSILGQRAMGGVIAYLLACIVTGVVLLIRPASAVILYLLSYMAFCVMVGVTGSPSDTVMNHQINGVFGAGIGAFLSILMWNYHYVNLRQKARIDSQQRELEHKNRELEKMAFFDWLTGLPNRRFFDRHIEGTLDRRHHDAVDCLILMDIDHFKQINDTFGHPAGDEVLCKCADVLAASIRRTDLISRLGGEEFLILLPETNLQVGTGVAEKLREGIEKLVVRIDGDEIRVTASFGVALLRHDLAGGGKNYYATADEALYRAKQNGRNRVEIFRNEESA